jgi:hypothetical protein
VLFCLEKDAQASYLGALGWVSLKQLLRWRMVRADSQEMAARGPMQEAGWLEKEPDKDVISV